MISREKLNHVKNNLARFIERVEDIETLIDSPSASNLERALLIMQDVSHDGDRLGDLILELQQEAAT